MLTRYLDKEQMGAFFFAATLAYFFAMLTELGTNYYLLREVAEAPDYALLAFAKVISLRLPLLAGCFVVLNGFAYWVQPGLWSVMIFTSIYVLLEEFWQSFSVLFLGLKQIAFRALIGVSTKAALIGLVFIAISRDGGLTEILAAHVLAHTVLIGLAGLVVWKIVGPFKLSWPVKSDWKIIQVSFPFFLLTVLGIVHFKVDALMLGFIHSYAAVATYEAAYKLLEVSRFLIRPVGMIMFPLCAELAVQGRWLKMRSLTRKMLLVTSLLGFGLAAGVLIAAHLIIPVVFGAEYQDAIPVLRVLYLSVPALYLELICTFIANSLHLEKVMVKVMVIGVIVNIGLNSLTIPLWGPLGAAWSTFISETLVAGWLIKINWLQLRHLIANLSVNLQSNTELQPTLSIK